MISLTIVIGGILAILVLLAGYIAAGVRSFVAARRISS